MRIGDLAEQTGASVRSLRYYEEQGLLLAQRTTSGQRTYDDDAVDRVRLLRQLYNAGLSSTTIATVMPCVDRPSAASTRETIAVMEREYARLDQQVADLVSTREHLAHLIVLAKTLAKTPGAAHARQRGPVSDPGSTELSSRR